MKVADMHTKSVAELTKHAEKLREKIAKNMQEQQTTDNRDTKQRRNLKRELAQTLTVLRIVQTKKDEE